jgi:molecular chaperone IbpA
MTSTTLPDFFAFTKKLDPFMIGFDETLELLRETAIHTQKAVGYPPYNIKKVKENHYMIEMACAGFTKSDIEITVEGDKLTVWGTAHDDQPATDYLYQGIAKRNFDRTFTLADKVVIKDAEMVNGMLKIWLENLVKTNETIKKIAIK